MASSLYVPQFVKHLDCIDCSVDEMPIPSSFSSRFGHRVTDSVKLKFRNGYKIRVTFDRDGMCVRPDGWRFVKHLNLANGFGDAVVPPQSFLGKFAATLPTRFKYFLNNGAEFRGHYNRQDGILTGLSSIPEYLRLEDLNFFDLVVFSFDNLKEFDVTCFDGRNVELVFHTYTIHSGAMLQSIRPASFFAVVVQPFHMLEYCHGVDISAEYRTLTDWWGKREEISIFRGRRCWELEIRKRADNKRTTIHDGWIQMRDDLQLEVGDTCWFKWKDESYHRFTVVVEKASG
ncbi:hypothetical protein DCAR_0102670 [Daucus carota subsp. sativus]|uniref:TF-B3 domain-containing protein n=1 Tax=Daucus carota subsp. sativus TaxID=79200 RepID=A0A169WUM1_DAUCS|nr:hypothetical protein DCAR_0102670 [Daucus carota subsp. sativus]